MFRSKSLAFTLMLGAASFAAGAALAQPQLESKAKQLSLINASLQAKGKARVIVRFALKESNLDTERQMIAREKSVRAGQDAILKTVFGSTSAAERHSLTRMGIEPMFAMSVTKAELDKLAADPRVVRVYPDKLNHLQLAQSVPLVGGTALQSLGGTGKGFAVGIIDTGVEHTHDFLAKRVVAGACFGTNDESEGFFPTCKGGVTKDHGKTAGDSCTVTSECFHGTHVAGIAAGKLTHAEDHPGEPTVGMAPKAKIIAVNVFSTNGTDLGAFDSDIERGLEFVFHQRTKLKHGVQVASANMSLGDHSVNTVPCDDESSLTHIINKMYRAKIATVISSGNDGNKDGVSFPACISKAIAVSATTKSDVVVSFSNVGDLVDVFAPGAAIRSSILNNQFGLASGTSMSAPHVTGAWAALRSLHPDASVKQIEKALEDTGKPIHDGRTGGIWTKPRIQVDDAHEALN